MFDYTYEAILADTEAARAIHRKIRYHVYCVERRFENPDDFPFGEEHDRWDDEHYTTHFIVRHRRSDQWVAAMRIILPNAPCFPLEALQCLTLTHPNRHLPRRELGEISRVCIIRSRTAHILNPYLGWNFSHVSKDGESEVFLGLIRAFILYGLHREIKHYYILVTAALARLSRRLGIVLHQAGVSVEHRGWRTPYLLDVQASRTALCRRSIAIRDMFDRKTLVYRPFSLLEKTMNEISLLMPPHLFPGSSTPEAFQPVNTTPYSLHPT